MTDIVVTAARVAAIHPQRAVIYDFEAAEAITAGQAVYQLTTGKVGVADANAAGKQQFRGIALNAAAAGGGVSVLKSGYIWGFAVSAMNGDALVYLSDTAGALGDAAGTMSVAVGRVVGIPEVGGPAKALHIDADWLRAWS